MSSAEERRKPQSILLRVGLIRCVTLGASLIASLAVARTVLMAAGTATFAAFALIQSLFALIPFLDFGVGAAVTNAAADRREAQFIDILRQALRVTGLSALITVVIASGLTALDLWEAILGPVIGASGSSVLVNLVCFAIALPLGLGARVLLGLGRQGLLAIVQALPTPCTLVVVLLGAQSESQATILNAPGLGLLCSAAVGAACAWIVARRSLQDDENLEESRRYPTNTFGRVSSSAFIMTIMMLVGFQSDRLVLSHTVDVGELALYSLVAQFFSPVWLLISAVGQSLWAHYRSRPSAASNLRSVSLSFFAASMLLSGVVGIASYWGAPLLSDGQIQTNVLICVGFLIMLAIRSAQLPLGMYLTDDEGFKLQALWSVPGMFLNVSLSILLAISIGPSGPLFATAIGTALFSLVPCAVEVRRRTGVATDGLTPRTALSGEVS
ncbi:lipopolysaccharide biosynthesis protein [Actinomycetospora sp. CA-101289]|uniref:lipopolysaccharide biosynthesis protein n=1 Tax=Actinomycetospora sp. CA-101289 TaxID=3239893 RepID=UPI003D978C75